jgi:hypothetical protein
VARFEVEGCGGQCGGVAGEKERARHLKKLAMSDVSGLNLNKQQMHGALRCFGSTAWRGLEWLLTGLEWLQQEQLPVAMASTGID